MKVSNPVPTASAKFQGKASASPQPSAALPSPAADSVRFGAEAPATPMSKMTAVERKAVYTMGGRYKKFLGEAVCAPFAAKTIIEEAEKRGFKPFPTDPGYVAKPGEKFYVNNRYASVALVVIGKNNPVENGFSIVGAHMDSPQLELKAQGTSEGEGVVRFKTKTRGGGIWGQWFNRLLGLAGVIYDPVMGADGKPTGESSPRFFRLDKPGFVIGGEAIHLNRTLNQGREIKPEEDMTPIVNVESGSDGSGASDYAKALLLKKGFNLDQAKRAQMFFFPNAKPEDTGIDSSLVIGAGQDDKLMCFAAMDALFDAAEKGTPDKTSIAAFFDNEEVGSLGLGGARSGWLEHVVGNVVRAQVPQPGDLTNARETALGKSVIMSADVSHAIQPQHAKYFDRQNSAHMGFGPAIKLDSDGHYATTAEGVALVEDLAARAGVPIQTTTPNQDISCGTTIGPMINSNTNALTIDIGTPVYSMHSPGEISSKADLYFTQKLFAAFFSNV